MTLPQNIADREHQKFVEDGDGNVSVRIGPNAIRDSSGNELGLNSYGMASTNDKQVMTQLKEMTDVLKDVRFQLQLITGAEIHE